MHRPNIHHTPRRKLLEHLSLGWTDLACWFVSVTHPAGRLCNLCHTSLKYPQSWRGWDKTHEILHSSSGYCPIFSVIITQPEKLVSMWWSEKIKYLSALCEFEETKWRNLYSNTVTVHFITVDNCCRSKKKIQLSLCQLHTVNKMRLPYSGNGGLFTADLRLLIFSSYWPKNCQHVVIPGCNVCKATLAF